MLTINLKQDLAEQISSLAGKSQAKAEAFVDKALRTYLAQFQREKIRAETEAFTQQHDELLTKYSDQYVAVHEGQVIDHGQDLRTLHLRVFNRFGQFLGLFYGIPTPSNHLQAQKCGKCRLESI